MSDVALVDAIPSDDSWDCHKLAFHTIRFVVGGLLIVSALLKTLEPSETATFEAAYDIPLWLMVVVVQGEWLLGVLLFVGVFPRFAWCASSILFSVFCAFSLYRGLAGFESCGCFGQFAVSPWWSLSLDVTVLILLGFGYRTFLRNTDGRLKLGRVVAFVGTYLLIGLPSLFYMSSGRAIATTVDTTSWRTAKLVYLQPIEWVNHDLPLKDFLSPPVDVTNGQWIVLFYHFDCPECQKALPKYEELASRTASSNDLAKVLLIEIPPYEENHVRLFKYAEHTRLSDEKDWFIEAPVELRVEEGKVVNASRKLPSVTSPD